MRRAKLTVKPQEPYAKKLSSRRDQTASITAGFLTAAEIKLWRFAAYILDTA